MHTDARTPADVALSYLSIWNERTYDRIPDLVSESFVMYDPFAPAEGVPGPRGEVHGREGLEAFVRGVVEGFPDFHVAVESTGTDGDRVLYEGHLTLTHEGPFFGVPATGQRAAVPYVGAIGVDGDRVASHRVFPPVLEIARELVPPFPRLLAYLPRLLLAGLRELVRRRGTAVRSVATRE